MNKSFIAILKLALGTALLRWFWRARQQLKGH